MNSLKVSNWSNENVKIGPYCPITFYPKKEFKIFNNFTSSGFTSCPAHP
jgi:hypothetical protein